MQLTGLRTTITYGFLALALGLMITDFWRLVAGAGS